VILFGKRFAVVFAVPLCSVSRLAENEKYNVQEVLTVLQVDKGSDETDR